MSLVTVEVTLASTHAVAKYPGWRLSTEALEAFANRLKQGTVPMLFDHDAAQPVRARCLDAWVETLTDGHSTLKATLEIDAGDWAQVESKFAEAGVTGGMSFTATAPQIEPRSGEAPIVTLAADAAAWTDLDRAEAGALLDAVVPTETNRLFQYSGVEVATIYIVLQGLGLGVLGNAIYDALKRLLSRRSGQTRIEIHRHDSKGNVTKAIVTTDDSDVARRALEALDPNQRTETVRFDARERLWLDS